MSVTSKLRGFILENFLFTDDEKALADSDSFLASGILDSTGIMEVILFVEEEYGIQVSEQEMVPENFDSINAMVGFLGKRGVS